MTTMSIARTRRYVAWLPIALIAAGVMMRLAWLALTRVEMFQTQVGGETLNVARSFAAHGTISDAYYVGQGPTAHIMPIPSIIAGLVYRLFGMETPAAEAVLTGWSIAIVMLSFWLLYKCFEELGSPLVARLSALAILCLLPLNFFHESIQFKVWEGAIAVATMAGFLLLILRLDRRERLGLPQVAAAGLLAALLLFISPPLGVPAYVCGVILLVRRVEPRRWPGMLLVVTAITIAVLAPWTARNMILLHKPIILRDNFGLEMALAVHPGAVDSPNQRAMYSAYFASVHPMRPAGHVAMLKAGGEVAYSDQLGAEAKRWIAANPVDFLRIALRNLSDFLFPPAWFWSPFGGPSTATVPKMAVNWLISLLALCGIVYGTRRVSARYGYAAVLTLVPILPYLLVQPNNRYRYIIFGLTVFLASDFVIRMIRRRVAASV